MDNNYILAIIEKAPDITSLLIARCDKAKILDFLAPLVLLLGFGVCLISIPLMSTVLVAGITVHLKKRLERQKDWILLRLEYE